MKYQPRGASQVEPFLEKPMGILIEHNMPPISYFIALIGSTVEPRPIWILEWVNCQGMPSTIGNQILNISIPNG